MIDRLKTLAIGALGTGALVAVAVGAYALQRRYGLWITMGPLGVAFAYNLGGLMRLWRKRPSA